MLVNTAMGQLGTKSSTLLGHYIISMALTAAFSRFTIPKAQWNPVYLVIDQFQEYADEEETPRLLRLTREYNVGVHIAHQTMHAKELNESIRSAISTNTSIKYAANPEGIDVGYMARDMRCDADFPKARLKYPDDNMLQFACFVRGMGLQHPFIGKLALGYIDTQPKINERSFQLLLQRNRDTMSASPPVAASEEKRRDTLVLKRNPPSYVPPHTITKGGIRLRMSAATTQEPAKPTPKPAKPVSTEPDGGDPADKWG